MIGVSVMDKRKSSFVIMDNFRTLPLADSVVFVPCTGNPFGVCHS
jgi:hypothetical protein